MKKVFFTLIFSCFMVNFAYAKEDLKKYEAECLEFIKAPTVEITSTYGKLKYDFSKDKEFLRKEAVKRFADHDKEFDESFISAGLTKVQDAFSFTAAVGQIEISNGYTCFFPTEIKIHFGYYSPTIYILNSLKKDSCLYNISLRHEKTHMQIYLEALDYFLPKLKQTAENLFKQVGVKIVKRSQAGKHVIQELNDDYLAVITAKMEKWRKSVEAEQLKLDTPEQYILENKLCLEMGESLEE